MRSQAGTILGIFSDQKLADEAVRELKDSGLAIENISIVAKDLEWSGDGLSAKSDSILKGTVAGIGTGAALGALAGLLVGIGAVTLPGIGALFIGGPIAAALGLTGAAATAVAGATSGVLAGGLLGALIGLGLPKDVATRYEERVRQGAIILAVNAYSIEDEENVIDIFERNNAEDVHVVGSKKEHLRTREHQLSIKKI